MTIKERFMDRVFIMTDGPGCWLWTGKTNSQGYGVFFNAGKGIQASRLSLRLFVRQDKLGECALHNCDNPLCVRPEHLRWGSKKDNAADCIARGRFKYADMWGRQGENALNSKLKKADVIEMRRLHYVEGESFASIGRKRHMNSGYVYQVCTGKKWGSVKEGLPNPQEQATPPTTRQEILRCIAVLSILRNTLLRSVS